MNVQIKGVRVTCPFVALERGQMFIMCKQVSNYATVYIKTNGVLDGDDAVNSVNLNTGEFELFSNTVIVRPLVDTSIISKVYTE